MNRSTLSDKITWHGERCTSYANALSTWNCRWIELVFQYGRWGAIAHWLEPTYRASMYDLMTALPIFIFGAQLFSTVAHTILHSIFTVCLSKLRRGTWMTQSWEIFFDLLLFWPCLQGTDLDQILGFNIWHITSPGLWIWSNKGMTVFPALQLPYVWCHTY